MLVKIRSQTLKTGAELLFEVFSQRYERSSTLVTSNPPFQGGPRFLAPSG